jgi:putative ABC transport system permease protein
VRSLRAWLIRAGALFGGAKHDREIEAELASHLQLHIDDNIRAGMPPEAARRDALLHLGGVAQTKERYRERRGLPWIDTLRQDFAYAFRGLRKNPGFAATAILTLALGIGANTAIFSVANAVLLRPLPFPNSDRLVMVFAANTRNGELHDVASYPDFLDWSRAHSVERMGAFAGGNVTVSGSGDAEYVRAMRVSASLFDTLGMSPALGRGFAVGEQQPGAPRVVVLSDGFWKRHYSSGANVLGETLRLNDTPYTIVGVMPPGFRVAMGATPEQLYVPLAIDANRSHGFLRVVGRLKPDVTVSEARAEFSVVAAQIAKAFPKSNANTGANVISLTDAVAVNVRSGLLVLLGVVALVLLIACTNVASLMLARGASRGRELAVRAALGASRGRIARQLLTESVLLAVAGGALGLAIGVWTARGLSAMLGATYLAIPRLDTVSTDVWVFGFAVVLSLTTGVIFGVVPAIVCASPDVTDALRESSRSTTGARAPRLRGGLVVLETALALLLLAAAGVLLQAFGTLRSTPTGFNADHVLTVGVWLPQPRFASRLDRERYYDELLGAVRGMPGVHSAAFVADLPLNGDSDGLGFHIAGRPDPAPGRSFTAGFNVATPDYFRTMGIPIVAGRDFAEMDRQGASGVIVINETAARRFWPNQSPLGQRIVLPREKALSGGDVDHERRSDAEAETDTLTIVGVSGDVRHESLAVPPRAEVFLNAAQSPVDWPWGALAIRTTLDPSAMAASIKGAAQAVDRNVPVTRVESMSDIVSRSMAAPRMYAVLLGAFAALALGLAAVGLYGLVSYTASQRTHELGVRVALGAARGEILRLVIGQGVRLAAIGAVVGLAAALATMRLLVGLVKSVKPNDPLTLGAVTVLLLAAAAVASYLPARRAARVDPMVALRAE